MILSKSRLLIFLGLASASLVQAAQTSNETLFDSWYTVSASGNVPVAYYHEKATGKEGKIHFQTEAWKREEDYINRESFGGFAQDDDSFTPLFYHFYLTYRLNETVIDATVENSNERRTFSARVKQGGKELPILKKPLPKKAFFSSFFPLWLKRNASIRVGQSKTFLTIVEDDVKQGFEIEPGRVRREPDDEFAKKTSTRRFSVNFRGSDSQWWLDSNGNYIRIEMGNSTIVTKVDEKTAKTFLGG